MFDCLFLPFFEKDVQRQHQDRQRHGEKQFRFMTDQDVGFVEATRSMCATEGKGKRSSNR